MNPAILRYAKKLFTWLLGSFNVDENGGSAKKLTAFAFMVLTLFLHVKFVDKDNAIEFLLVDVSAVLASLGIATFDKIQMRNSKTSSNGNDQSGTS